MADALMNQGSELLIKGRFEEAVEAFNEVLKMDPAKEAYLWQRGVSLYFSGKYVDGIKQFEKGHEAEETVWRFLCAAQASSAEVARKEFVQPKKSDDKVPMKQILALFEGTGNEEAVVAAAEAVAAGPGKESSLFYAYYYTGCYNEAIRENGKALDLIRTALKYKTQDYIGRIAKVHETYLARKLGHKRHSIPSLSFMPTGQAQTILPDGYIFSKIIRGCWQLSKGHQLKPLSDGQHGMDAINEDFARFQDKGITTYDTGDTFAGIEETLGKCIRTYREGVEVSGGEAKVQVHSKFSPDLDVLASVDLAYVRQSLLRSLNRLNVDRLDLVELQWWDFGVKNYVATAQHLVTLQKEGLLRHVGLTDFDAAHLQEVLDAGVPVSTCQVQYSLLDQRPKGKFTELCAENHIQILAYGTLAGGFVTDKWLNQPEPSTAALTNHSLVLYKPIIDASGGWTLFQELLAALKTVATAHSTTIAAIAVKWVLSQQNVGAVIFGSRDSSHLDSILPSALSMKLTEEDLSTIGAVLQKLKPVHGGEFSKIVKTNTSLVNGSAHFNEAAHRYTELMHHLHPERASELGLRAYDSFGPITSIQNIESIATHLKRVIEEFVGFDQSRLDKSQLADLAAIICDAKLRLFRVNQMKEAKTDPFIYLSPGYRGIRYMANMLGHIPRAEQSLLARLKKFVLGLKHGITNLDKPPAYLVKTAVVYIEGLVSYFDAMKQKFQHDYESNRLDELSRQISAASQEAITLLGQFSTSIQSKAVKTYGLGQDIYVELVKSHLQKGLTVEDLFMKAETLQKSAKKELQAIIMSNRATSPNQTSPQSPPTSNRGKSFSINLRRRSVIGPGSPPLPPPANAPLSNETSPTLGSPSGVASPTLMDNSLLAPSREHGRSFSFGTHSRSFSFGRRRSTTVAPSTEINHLGQLPNDSDVEKLFKDVSSRTKSALVSPGGIFSTLAKLASLIDEEAAILNNIATAVPAHLSLSVLRSYHSGDIAVIAIHETLREFVQLAVRMNAGPRLFAEQGLPSILAQGCVLYLADVLARENFFSEHEYQRQRTVHRRQVIATRAILEIKMHTGMVSPDEFRQELMASCEVPERPADEFARQSLREPTVAAAGVLGYQLLLDLETKYGSDPAGVRKLLDYVFAGDGLCLELTKL